MNVISFSLYGTDDRYCHGAVRNVELAKRIYPDWVCRFYVDSSVPENCVEKLKSLGAQIFSGNPSKGPMYGRYWRFQVAADTSVTRFIIRDTDSRLNTREKAAVDEWIISGKKFHMMRDHHAHNTRVLGGMWGGTHLCINGIQSLIERWGKFDQHGQCDAFCSEILYPFMQGDYLCHDSIGHFDDHVPFPPHYPMQETSFVGQIIDPENPISDIWRLAGEFECKFNHMNLEYHNLNEAYQRLEEELATLKFSRSWRITKPLRSAKKFLIDNIKF